MELVGELEERSPGQTNLDQISRPAQDQRERSWGGCNFFLGGELSVLLAIVRRHRRRGLTGLSTVQVKQNGIARPSSARYPIPF